MYRCEFEKVKVTMSHQTLLTFVVVIWTWSAITAEDNAASSCDPAVRRYFGWCEQWDCRNNCSCTTNDECRQYCESTACRHMECRSDMTCTQSLHSTKRKPRAIQVQAESPFVTQDCSEGECTNLIATRPRKSNKDLKYFAFQNCVDGRCKNVSSHVEITKQFCGYCDHMECSGERALNCTQKCVVNTCKVMYCDARQCEQACSHGSHCHMTCGPNTIDCVQVCRLGSKCSMLCNAKSCNYNCTDGSDCNLLKPTTPRPEVSKERRPGEEIQTTTDKPGTSRKTKPRFPRTTEVPRKAVKETDDSNLIEVSNPIVFKALDRNDIFEKAKYYSLSSTKHAVPTIIALLIVICCFMLTC